MKKFYIILIIVCIVAFFLGKKVGLILNHDYPLRHQTSEHQWKGPISEKYSNMMCKRYNLPQNGGWCIDCPKCEGFGASIRRWAEDSWTDYRLFTNTVKIDDVLAPYSGCQWYCAKCLYPLGTDWKIINLSESGVFATDKKAMAQRASSLFGVDFNDYDDFSFIRIGDCEFEAAVDSTDYIDITIDPNHKWIEPNEFWF